MLGLGIVSFSAAITASMKAQATEGVAGEPKPAEKMSIFKNPSEWYIKNWPTNYPITGKISQNGKFPWKNNKGIIVGEIEMKSGALFNGIAYIQGASDYRMVNRYDKGKLTLLKSYLLKEDHWVVFQDNLFGEQVGADQPATAPESTSKGKDKPKTESKVRPQ